MINQQQLSEVYEKYRIKDTYRVSFPQFVNDIGKAITGRRASSDLDLLVLGLMGMYQSQAKPKK